MDVVPIKPETIISTPLPQRNPENDNAEKKVRPITGPNLGGGNAGGGGGQGNRNNRGNRAGFNRQNRMQQQQQQQQQQIQGNIKNEVDGGKIPNLMNDNVNHHGNNRDVSGNTVGGGSAGGGGGGGGGQRGGGMGQQRGGGAGGGGGSGNFGGGGGGGGQRGGRRGNNRDDGNNRGGGGGDRNMNRKSGDDYMMQSKLKQISGPTHELPPVVTEESKFSGRNRLYIGNLTNDVTEEELRELFKPFGEISEAFINAEKNFGFLKVDYHVNAERAKRELDGTMRKNRQLRIRFAPNATIIRVKNLTPFVSNELLFKSFEIFGPVERAVIIVDDRGKVTGEGLVEFSRKAGATAALRYCNEKCFFLTSSLRPCVVESFEMNDETDGLPDKAMNKKTQEFYKARQIGPRFSEANTFEHEYGTRWKQLHELFKQKHEALKRELLMEEEKLEAQMEFARYEHETELLREQLRQREHDRERQKMEWEMRERQCEELRTRDEEQMRRQQDDMQLRMNRQDDELRRRQQENTLFMKAQQLNSLLDQQEISQGSNGNGIPKNNDAFNNTPGINNRNDQGGGNNNNNRMFTEFGGNNNNNNNPGGGMNNNPNINNNIKQDQGFLASFEFGQNNQQNPIQGNIGNIGGNNVGGSGPRPGNRWNNDRRGNIGNAGGEDFQTKRRRF